MAKSVITKQFGFNFSELSDWGTFNATGTKLNLSRSFRDFKLIAVRIGWDSVQSGIQVFYFPTSFLNANSCMLIHSIDSYGGSGDTEITLRINSDTQVEIVRSNVSGTIGAIRQIVGIN